MTFKRALRLAVILLLLWALFYLFFILPNPWVKERDIPLSRISHSRRIALDLIRDEAIGSGTFSPTDSWVRLNPYDGRLQVSLGKYLWMVESRRSLPADRCPAFTYTPSASSRLDFGIGVRDAPSRYRVSIDGQTVFARTLTPRPSRGSFLYRKLVEPFRFRFKPQKGFWEDITLSLAPWAGKSITIEIHGDSGFVSSPRISERCDRGRAPANVIVIQIDALRADMVERDELRGLSRLRREGALFRNAYANANWTRPSNYTQFFARFSPELGISAHDFYIHPLEKMFFYRNRFLSLPQYLSRQGYADAAIGDNIFLHGFSKWGVDIGFTEVKDFEKLRYESVYIVEEALRWIARRDGTPFFLFLDFNQTHSPYKPPVNRVNFLEACRDPRYAFYKGCVRYVDRFVERLLQKLRVAGYLENTLVVINSDHGENFANFGRRKPGPSPNEERVSEHASSLKREEIRIPLLFYWPGKIAAGTFNQPVSLLDVPRTVLGLIGGTPPVDWGGQDLSPLLRGEIKTWTPPPVLTEGKNELSLISPRYQYITGSENRSIEELSHIASDPLNRRNLAAKRPHFTEAMRRRLKALFPPPYPVWILYFHFPAGREGKVAAADFADLSFTGGKGAAIFKEGSFILRGRGYLYWVFRRPPSRFHFSGGPLQLTPLQIAQGRGSETTLEITAANSEWLLNPYNNAFKGKTGFWLYATSVLAFTKDNLFNPAPAAGESMKQILIDWGYMKK